MAKDYTKYSVKNVGTKLTKSGLIKAIVKDYAAKLNPDYETILQTFPDNLQGTTAGVFKKRSEVELEKKWKGRFFEADPITLSDGEVILVCNQWGIGNIAEFLVKAGQLGYEIAEEQKDISLESSSSSSSSYDLRELDIFDFVNQLDKLNEQGGLEELYHDLDSLVLEDASFASFAVLAEYYSQENGFNVMYEFESKEDYVNMYSFGRYQLEELNLVELAIEESGKTSEEINEGGEAMAAFQRYLLSYLYYNIKYSLADEGDGDLIGSFLFSLNNRKCEAWESEEDFVTPFILFYVKNTFGIAITDYDETTCEIPPFSENDRWEESGYDYLRGGREILEYLND